MIIFILLLYNFFILLNFVQSSSLELILGPISPAKAKTTDTSNVCGGVLGASRTLCYLFRLYLF